jgi:hypothetical protein
MRRRNKGTQRWHSACRQFSNEKQLNTIIAHFIRQEQKQKKPETFDYNISGLFQKHIVFSIFLIAAQAQIAWRGDRCKGWTDGQEKKRIK